MDGEGRLRVAFYCSCPPNLREAKLKKRSKKTTPQTPVNTRVGEIDQLMF